jgi:selenide,water dikinase
VLRPIQGIFRASEYPNLLVGLDEPDDAAVWQIDEEKAIVITTDFFTPVVDDPYDYGAIAAANSLSDVYAMGGSPFLALNIAALPPDLPADILTEILRGGAEKVHEAGVVIAGGHTIQDKEPKYGLVVVGLVNPRKFFRKSGAKPGDYLILTKPLGFGTTTTALKRGLAKEEHLQEAVIWMKTLNRKASEIAQQVGLTTATDITGYSLLGHAWEIASLSAVGLRLHFEAIPFTEGAKEYAAQFIFPGGAFDNRLYFQEHVRFDPRLTENEQMLLFDPQTSGGLLFAASPEQRKAFEHKAKITQQPYWVIGEVTSSGLIEVD